MEKGSHIIGMVLSGVGAVSLFLSGNISAGMWAATSMMWCFCSYIKIKVY